MSLLNTIAGFQTITSNPLPDSFAPRFSDSQNGPPHPYEIDAYNTGIPSDAETKARFFRNKEAAKKAAESVETHRFDNGITVETFNKGDTSVTYVTTKDSTYVTTAKSDANYQITFRGDGSRTRTDKNNGSFMSSSLTQKGFYHDVSQFKPSTDILVKSGADSGGTIDIHYEKGTGRASIVQIEGNVAANSIFIKCRNGGIYTNDSRGNLILAQSKDLPRDISRTDKEVHQELEKIASQNPELIRSQGIMEMPFSEQKPEAHPQLTASVKVAAAEATKTLRRGEFLYSQKLTRSVRLPVESSL